jgi:peptide/nickel transport system substrate-binding protein
MKKDRVHKMIPKITDQYKKGALSRREFLHFSTAMGLSCGAAAMLGGFPMAGLAASTIPQRGGNINISMVVLRVTHPAQSTWSPVSNLVAPIAEYLTEVNPDNSVSPALLENWEPSADLKTWTLNLRRGIKFNNGDDFNADDVVFSIKQWLDPAIQSSMINYLGPYLSSNDIEKVNSHQVKLHLKKARYAVPYHLAEFPANILNHRTFEGDFIKAPHGTGPFELGTYRPGEVCTLKARSDYWKKGADGSPLPYLDSIKFVDMGYDVTPQITALKNGEIDLISQISQEVPQACKGDPRFEITPVETSVTGVLRMRTDLAPWSDNRVRQALKACQHREKILALTIQNEGILGHDFHVSPKQPSYCPKPVPKYDPEKSRALLKAAGYPDGLAVTLNFHSGTKHNVRLAEILKEDCRAGGFNVTLNPTPEYWDKWTEYDLGITQWAHHPVASTYLNVGYGVDQQGKPLPWNETRWVDKEFHNLLEEASATLDIAQRRKIMCKLEQVMADRGGVGISYWMNTWWVIPKNVHNLPKHPNTLLYLNSVWKSS